jgi:hypothetical protein
MIHDNIETVSNILESAVKELQDEGYNITEDTIDDHGRFINLSDGTYSIHISMTPDGD